MLRSLYEVNETKKKLKWKEKKSKQHEEEEEEEILAQKWPPSHPQRYVPPLKYNNSGYQHKRTADRAETDSCLACAATLDT